MGLFDKKMCELCGGKASMLGKKKIQDGYLCGECKKQLSEFSSGWKERTIDQVREHIAQREANKQTFAQFVVEESLGPRDELKLDRTHGWFYLALGRDWKQKNPQVFSIDQLREFYVEVDFDHFSDDEDGDGIPDHLQQGGNQAFGGVQASLTRRRGGSLNADSIQNMFMMQGLSGIFRMDRDAYDHEGFPREVSRLTCVIMVNDPFISKIQFSTTSLDNDDPDNQREINQMVHAVKSLQMLRNASGSAVGMGGIGAAGMPGAGMPGAGMPGAGMSGMQPGMMPGQQGMQPGMGTGQPGMGTIQPGMAAGQPGMQAGMAPGQSGVMPGQAGMPSAQPGQATTAPQAGATPGQAKFCSGCGAPLGNTPFCGSCGAPAN